MLSAKLKVGKKSCSVDAHVAKTLASGEIAKVGVEVAGKCLGALKKAGKGRLAVKIEVTDALGAHQLTLRSTLVPGRAKHRRKAHR